MRQRFEWAAAVSAPAPAAALERLGIPPGVEAPPRISTMLDAALGAYRETSQPRAVIDEVSVTTFAGLYRGEGRNAPTAPLEDIYPKAERLAVFAATLGAGVTARVRSLFEGDEPAMAVTLDALASAATDRLVELLGARFMAGGGKTAREDWRFLSYSPGYCGWHLTGQRALFDFLRPQDIGVTLQPSCLMEPLKSVSGVIVVGPRRIHRFPPDYPFCAACADRPCRHRIASLVADA